MAYYIVVVISPLGVLVDDEVSNNIAVLEENGFVCLEEQRIELNINQAHILSNGVSRNKEVSNDPNPPPDSKLYKNINYVEDYLSGPSVVLLMKSSQAQCYSKFEALRNQRQIDYSYGSKDAWFALRDKNLLFPKEPVLERTFLMMKPGWTQQEYAAVIESLDNAGFVLIGKSAKLLTPDQASHFGPKNEVPHLTSDVSVSFVVERLNGIEELQLLCGPVDSSNDNNNNTNNSIHRYSTAIPYLRTRLGNNTLYASDSIERVRLDTSVLFPLPFPIERTLLLIKPDIRVSHEDSLLSLLTNVYGFTIIVKDTFVMSKARCEEYCSYLFNIDPTTTPTSNNIEFEANVRHLSSGPLTAIVLTKAAAVASLRSLCGPADPLMARNIAPHSIRARLGRDSILNGVNCSLSPENAKLEINFFFPGLRNDTVPTITQLTEAMNARCGNNTSLSLSKQSTGFDRPQLSSPFPPATLQSTLINGLVALCKIKPVGHDALLTLADWLERNNPNKPLIQNDNSSSTAGPLVSFANEEKEESYKVDNTNTISPLELNDRVLKIISSYTLDSSLTLTNSLTPSEPLANVLSSYFQNDPLRIIWVLGSPFIGKGTIGTRLAQTYNYDYINMKEVLTNASVAYPLYGEDLRAFERYGKPLPTHITLNLLIRAITNILTSNNNNPQTKKELGFVISNFPRSLDESFAFEKIVGNVDSILNLYLPEEGALIETVKRAMTKANNNNANKTGAIDKNVIERSVLEYSDNSTPVLEHYTEFGKVVRVDASGSIEKVYQSALKALPKQKKFRKSDS